MADPSYRELTDFSKSSNNLPAYNTNKLRNRFMRWRNWRRLNPYEEILDEEANRVINSSEWRKESNIDEENLESYEPIENGYEEVDLSEPNIEDLVNVEESFPEITEASPLLESVSSGSSVGGAGVIGLAPVSSSTLSAAGVLGQEPE